jgi:hypothetical protein
MTHHTDRELIGTSSARVLALNLQATTVQGYCRSEGRCGSSYERAAFKREHSCPSTGRASGACPGWIMGIRRGRAGRGSSRASRMRAKMSGTESNINSRERLLKALSGCVVSISRGSNMEWSSSAEWELTVSASADDARRHPNRQDPRSRR